MSESLNRHIVTLLRRHDCVIVPGIGAFLASDIEARWVDLPYPQMLPPERRISFNSAITDDDGLLTNSISRRLKIPYEQARERMQAESELLQRRLKSEGSVELPYVGTLTRHIGGRLDFEPAASWLPMLPVLSLNNQQCALPMLQVVANNQDETRRVAVVRVPLHVRRMRAAAAALIIALVGFVLSTPINLEHAQNASMALPEFTAPDSEPIELVEAPRNLELAIAPAPAEGTFDLATRPQTAGTSAYIAVVGSFNTMAKAELYIAQQPLGHHLRAIKCGSMVRIYAASADTPNEAMARARAIPGFSQAFPDAWPCRK